MGNEELRKEVAKLKKQAKEEVDDSSSTMGDDSEHDAQSSDDKRERLEQIDQGLDALKNLKGERVPGKRA